MPIILNHSFKNVCSKYRGHKWDGFIHQLPWSLLNHINGNAFYNLSHPVLNTIIEQLEKEADTDANSVPFDYRIAQLVEEVQTGLAPVFFLRNKETEDRALSANFISSMAPFNLNQLIRETPLIGNYASSNVLTSSLNPLEVVIHGARLLQYWDHAKLGVRRTMTQTINHTVSHFIQDSYTCHLRLDATRVATHDRKS